LFRIDKASGTSPNQIVGFIFSRVKTSKIDAISLRMDLFVPNIHLNNVLS